MSLTSREPPRRGESAAAATAASSSTPRRVLDDPIALRALAHPLRLKLHLLLVREGTCSAAYAARELDISQALASHHLHQLAKYGFAEQTAGRDRRERPWRALSTSATWLGADGTPEGAIAADLLEQTLVNRSVVALGEWQRRRRDPGHEHWHDVAGVDTSLVYMSSEEAARFGKAFEALCRPFIESGVDGPHRAGDSRPVELTLLLVPLVPTASGA